MKYYDNFLEENFLKNVWMCMVIGNLKKLLIYSLFFLEWIMMGLFSKIFLSIIYYCIRIKVYGEDEMEVRFGGIL